MKQNLLKSMLGRCVIACLGFGLLLGICQQSLAADPTPKVPSGVQDYDQWSGFKEGSSCKHESTFMENGKKTQMTETFTLTNVAADKLTVSRETVEKDAQGKESKSTPTLVLSPRTASSGIMESQVTEGDEDVTVGTEKIRCHYFKVTTKREGMSRSWTIWVSPKVPGGVVKQIAETTKNGKVVDSMTDTLKEYKSVPR